MPYKTLDIFVPGGGGSRSTGNIVAAALEPNETLHAICASRKVVSLSSIGILSE